MEKKQLVHIVINTRWYYGMKVLKYWYMCMCDLPL